MNNSDLFWQSYLNIEDEVLKLTDYVFVTDKNNFDSLKIYSVVSANLLIRIAVQIEALSKHLYNYILGLMNSKTKDSKKYNKDRILFDKDCLALINKTFHIDEKAVNIITSRVSFENKNRRIYPLSKSEINDETGWQESYQAVKHDFVECLDRGNIGNVLHACAALYLLNIYNLYKESDKFKNISESSIRNLDYSFGSKLYSVDKPKMPGEFKIMNIPVPSESPFVARANDENFIQFMRKQYSTEYEGRQKIDEMLKNDEDEFNNFLDEYNKTSGNKYDRYQAAFIWKFQKAAPKELPFEERKRKFLSIYEVRHFIDSNINYVNFPDEITEDNIDQEINKLGFIYGVSYLYAYVVPLFQSLHFDMYIEVDSTSW